MIPMKICVLYFSRTGNTKSMAEAIARSTNATIKDMASVDPSTINGFDVLILGTPVNGFGPAQEAMVFIGRIPKAEGRKAIVFCTYDLVKFGTLGTLAGMLKNKGYNSILHVSKKKAVLGKTDFSEIIEKIRTALN
jgi:flavodoxin